MSKIVTINVPASWIPAIGRLVGCNSLNSSRSELVRKAISKKLKEVISLSKANMIPKPTPEPENEEEKLKEIVRESLKKAATNGKLQNL